MPRMLVALMSETHGRDDIGHASALRDESAIPVDEAFQILRPSSYDTSPGRMRSPRQFGGGPFRCGVIEPCSHQPHSHRGVQDDASSRCFAAVDDDVDGVDVHDAEVIEPGGAETQVLSYMFGGVALKR